MANVTYRGVSQPYELLTPAQQRECHEEQRMNAPRPSHENTDANGYRSMSYADKAAMRKAGYQGDLSALPPGQDSGVLVKATTRTPEGHIVNTYHGSPKVWMNDFAPPVSQKITAWRRGHTDLDWAKTTLAAARRFKEDHPDLVGIDSQLMYSADPERYVGQTNPHARLHGTAKHQARSDQNAKPGGGLMRKLLGG